MSSLAATQFPFAVDGLRRVVGMASIFVVNSICCCFWRRWSELHHRSELHHLLLLAQVDWYLSALDLQGSQTHSSKRPKSYSECLMLVVSSTIFSLLDSFSLVMQP